MHQVAKNAKPDLRELITARGTELVMQAEKLSQRLQEVLEELTVAERVALRPAEQLHVETKQETPPPGGAGQVAGRAVLVPQRERDTEETVLPEDYQRIIDVVRRTDTPIMVKQVCGELKMSTNPARAEALRATLNRLADRGRRWPTGNPPLPCELVLLPTRHVARAITSLPPAAVDVACENAAAPPGH
ncbi:hypothetical protein ACH47Z_46125 [Streptomyces sp. NPDC020192]|uniref:hypothetical protein n=1 Tax=Streptomyces sp. NPDC020192 TaxID=3365066 RepID=UPI0037BA72B3